MCLCIANMQLKEMTTIVSYIICVAGQTFQLIKKASCALTL